MCHYFFPSPLLFDHAVDGLCVLPVLDLKPSHAVHFEFFLLFIFVPNLCTQFVYFIRRGRNAAAAVLIPGLRREKKALPLSLSPGGIKRIRIIGKAGTFPSRKMRDYICMHVYFPISLFPFHPYT